MAKSERVELALANPILEQDPTVVAGIIQANLGDSVQLSISDLDKIGVEGSSFEVPSLEGTENVKEVSGVIMLSQSRRSFWKTNTITGDAPDCYSDDGIVGVGDPGGACATCPMAQFGSAGTYVEGAHAGSQSQACKQTQMLFLFTEDGLMPKLLVVPPTSLKNLRQYMVALTGRLIQYDRVITRFTLEKAQNDAGMPYSKITPKFGGRLDPELAEKIAKLSEAIVPRLRTVRIMSQEDIYSTSDDITGEQ